MTGGVGLPLGVERLPADWTTAKLKHIAQVESSNVDKKSHDDEMPVRLCNYTDVYYNDRITRALSFMEATATPREIARFSLHRGDILLTKDSEHWSDIAVPALVVDDLDGVLCGYHLAHVRPNASEVDSGFLFYCFAAEPVNRQLQVVANGVTRFGLPIGELRGAVIPIPPVADQRLIADFLDEKTAAIDALIAKKERLIDLIEEKRQAAITRAVTKGLDPDVPMKDSGVEWLGEVPDHWQVTRLKFGLQRIEQGWSPACENRPAAEDEWGVMRAGCVNGSEFNPNDNKALPAGVEPLSEYEIRPGDVLMSRANTRALLGSAAMVGAVRPRLILCDKLYRLTPRKTRLVPEFLVFLLSAWPARYQLERDATGASSSMQNIGQDTVLNLVLPVPSVAEQRQIAGAMQKQNRSYQESKRHLQNSIIRLQEYRQTLVSAAVTGQIDIRSRSTRADRVFEEALS